MCCPCFSNLRGIGRTPPPKAHRSSGSNTKDSGGAATVDGDSDVLAAHVEAGSSSGGAVMEARVLRLERERNMLKLEMDRQRIQFEEERQACEYTLRIAHAPHPRWC